MQISGISMRISGNLQVHTEPLLISSRPDLSLEDVDLFLDSLGCSRSMPYPTQHAMLHAIPHAIPYAIPYAP